MMKPMARNLRVALPVLAVLCAACVLCSYAVARGKAVAFTTKYGNPDRLTSALMLFACGKLRPMWVFS
jgi:hypothetical protein